MPPLGLEPFPVALDAWVLHPSHPRRLQVTGLVFGPDGAEAFLRPEVYRKEEPPPGRLRIPVRELVPAPCHPEGFGPIPSLLLRGVS